MTIEPDPDLDAALNRRGVSVVRLLLQTSAGKGSGSLVADLKGDNGKPILRRDAEDWLRRKESERDRQARSDRWWTQAAAVAAIIAAGISFLAAIISLAAWLCPITR